MEEFWISFGVMCFVSLIMISIGVSQLRSKESVGFYSGEKPPRREEIHDIMLWNRKHGILWILYGIAIVGSFLLSAVIDDAMLSSILLIGVIVGGIPVMIWCHERLKKKFFIKENELSA